MNDWIRNLNFLELSGLVSWCIWGPFWTLVVGWLVACAVEGRKVAREKRERDEEEAAIVREWMENEERRWSERCEPLIERLIHDSQTEDAT